MPLLLLFAADRIAVWGLAVAIASAVIALIAAVAAIYAAVYAKAAPTKEDLARVEANAAETTRHLRRQTEKDELAARAELIPFSVWGHDPVDEGLTVKIMCDASEALPTRIGLYNQYGATFGSASVVRDRDGNYSTELDAETVLHWFQGGNPAPSGDKRFATLRLYVALDGKQTYRDFSVQISRTTLNRKGKNHESFLLEGSI